MRKITTITILFFINLSFSAAAQVNSDVAESEPLPGITTLPVLNLSDTTLEPIEALKNIDFANLVQSSQMANFVSVDDDILTVQEELIERLQYKKKEGPKLKRFKPQVRVSVLDDGVGASWKD